MTCIHLRKGNVFTIKNNGKALNCNGIQTHEAGTEFLCYTFLLVTSAVLSVAVNGMPPWTPSVSSELLPQYALAVMRSNRWPGAVAFAKER